MVTCEFCKQMRSRIETAVRDNLTVQNAQKTDYEVGEMVDAAMERLADRIFEKERDEVIW